MLHTEDGGKTWQPQPIADLVKLPDSALDTGVDPGDVNLYAVTYADPDHAWVVGEFGTIMASTDGGRTWTQQHAPVESTLFGVHFADAQRGWAVGHRRRHPRHDRRRRHLDARDGRRSRSGPSTTSSSPGTTGWITGDSGTMLKSSDGGATWVVEPLPIQLAAHWIRSVWLGPTGKGLAVGNEGLVFQLDGTTLTRLTERAS